MRTRMQNPTTCGPRLLTLAAIIAWSCPCGPADAQESPVDSAAPAVGCDGAIGCDANATVVERLEITEPGVYENYLVESNWGRGNRVKVTADDVTIRNFEIRNAAGNGIAAFGKNLVIENCRIHHLLRGSYDQPIDVHGITGFWGNVTIRNCEIYYVSGDAIQFDPDRQFAGNVTIENCTLWTGPLPEDAAEFQAGQRPGENGIDLKTPSPDRVPERSRMIVRNCLFYGWNQPGQIGVMAALNLKENVTVEVDNCVLHDNEVCFRVRGPTYRGGAEVTIRNCAVYDSRFGVRAENAAENLHIHRLGFGDGIGRRYRWIGGVRLQREGLPGYVNTGEFIAPPLEEAIRDGLREDDNGAIEEHRPEESKEPDDIPLEPLEGGQSGTGLEY